MLGDAVAVGSDHAPPRDSAGPVHDEDLYRTSGDSAVTGTDDRGPYVVLDSPLFYPQGGGQKGDRGLHPRGSAEIGEMVASMRTTRGRTLVSFGPRPIHG